jgi:DNA-binding GntR family transcriptional regulator
MQYAAMSMGGTLHGVTAEPASDPGPRGAATGPRPLRTLLPVAPRVLREQVRDALRDAILSASLPPGTRVGEEETAAVLGVSRTPVREAIRELVQEGLLAFVAHRGAVVVSVSDDEINAAYRVKAVLEEEAMSRATTRLTPGDLAELRSYVDEMAEQGARGEFVAANTAEWKFHAKIADVAQLGLLRRTWTSVDDMGRLTTLQLVATHGSFPRYLSDLAERHERLLDVLEAGNPRRAADIGREHLEEGHRLFLADLEDHAPGNPDTALAD